MGFFDRVKKLFGQDEADEDENDTGARALADDKPDRDAAHDRSPAHAKRGRGSGRDRERPPLADAPPPSQTIEDALAARESGKKTEARDILIEIDKGGGLRTLLRAAAALEANDEAEVRELLPKIAAEEPRWRIDLQVAAALADPTKAAPFLEKAAAEGAPAWALAWSRATSDNDDAKREGLVELLYADAALARTVAARDLKVPNVVPDGEAGARYAAFAHGRDSIRRFGADLVASLLRRAHAAGGPR